MKRALSLSCIFSACVLLSACQTNPSMNSMMMMPSQQTKAQCIETGITFDRDEIAMANLAKKRAVHPQVRHFANYLHHHYSMMLNKKMHYVHKEHIKLETSSASNSLHARGQQEMSQLESSSRENFDRNFIHDVIEDHNGAIAYFDQALRTQTNPHAIARLKEARRQAEMCLAKAQHIQQSMGY